MSGELGNGGRGNRDGLRPNRKRGSGGTARPSLAEGVGRGEGRFGEHFPRRRKRWRWNRRVGGGGVCGRSFVAFKEAKGRAIAVVKVDVGWKGSSGTVTTEDVINGSLELGCLLVGLLLEGKGDPGDILEEGECPIGGPSPEGNVGGMKGNMGAVGVGPGRAAVS